MSQHEPLHNFDAQQAAQDAFPLPLTLADLSALEREALAMLRADEPRKLSIVAAFFGTLELRRAVHKVQAELVSKGLLYGSHIDGFVRVTPEGYRLQVDLFSEAEL